MHVLDFKDNNNSVEPLISAITSIDVMDLKMNNVEKLCEDLLRNHKSC